MHWLDDMSKEHITLDGRRWRAARRLALRRARYRCECCGRAGRLEVHHKVDLQHGGAAYDLDNLQVLARDCHILLHQRHTAPERAAWRAFVAELLPTHS